MKPVPDGINKTPKRARQRNLNAIATREAAISFSRYLLYLINDVTNESSNESINTIDQLINW